MSPGPYVTVKNTSSRKSLHQFTEVDVKQKTAVFKLVADKSKHKDIITGIMLLYRIPKRRGHTKINYQVKQLFIILFYSILSLWNPQLQMITLKCLLTVTLKNRWFKNIYHKCLSDNFTISWLFQHNRVYLRRLWMQKIILSLVLLR